MNNDRIKVLVSVITLLVCTGSLIILYEHARVSLDLSISNAAGMDAQFISQSVRSTMTPGQSVQVSVTMKNVGTIAWTKDTKIKLGSQNPQDNRIWGIGRVELAVGETIAPQAQKTFTFTVKAPNTSGTYDFQWKMLQEGVTWFGGPSTNISVVV